MIATHPKCGTTWTEHIVLNLLHHGRDVPLLYDVAPWIELRCKRDMRTPFPDDELIDWMESLDGRRQIKCHLPLDYIPYHEQVRYIVVGRDTRDAYMSWHSHILNAKKKKPFIEIEDDLHAFWPHWLTHAAEKHAPLAEEGQPHPLFEFYHSWWKHRHLPNVLFVHFDDLLGGIDTEIARIADFLDIHGDPEMIDAVARATLFSTMKDRSETEMPNHPYIINEGTNGRWKSILNQGDLLMYENAKDEALKLGVPDDCLAWLERGRS